MAKRSSVRPAAPLPTMPATVRTGKIPGQPFSIPTPKGLRIGRIPLSSASAIGPRQLKADPEEEARFSSGGRVVVGGKKVDPARMTSAQRQANLRMRGVRLQEEEPEEQPEEIDADEEQEEQEDLEQQDQEQDDETVLETPVPPVLPAIPVPVVPPPDSLSRAQLADPRAALWTPPTAQAASQLAVGEVASPTVIGLSAKITAVTDTDNLWDWIRQDRDYGYSFLGRKFTSSYELHEFVKQVITVVERQGLAILRSIFYQDHHLGFAMLSPILAEERTALMHVYLRPDMRPRLAQLVGPLVELAQIAAPGVHLAVAPLGDAQARLYRGILEPLGFKAHTMLIR